MLNNSLQCYQTLSYCKNLTHSEESVQTHTSWRLFQRAPVFFRLLSHHYPAPATLLTIPPEVTDSSGHANASLPQLEDALTLMGVGTTDHPQFPF